MGRALQACQKQEPSQPNKEEDVLSKEKPTLITTVTNNNRRANQKRQKAQAAEKKRSLGLVQPYKGAYYAKYAAYSSISPNNKPIITQIIK